MNFQILLYYKYIHITDPEALRKAQKELCERLNLKGRIIVAEEGINGTVGGTKEATEEYIQEMVKDSRFSDIHWKRSAGPEDTFPRLSVKVRPEIVTTKITDVPLDPEKNRAPHISAEELHEWYKQGKNFKVVDMRNTYEIGIGTFKDSFDPETMNFRDLPQSLERLSIHKDDVIVPVCTGGVRCEKGALYLKEKGFDNVYALDGGIVTYMEKYPGQDFLGTLYVFDKRKKMDFCKPGERDVIGKCSICNNTTERVENCADDECHLQFICCDDCIAQYDGMVYCKECGNAHGEIPRSGRFMRVV